MFGEQPPVNDNSQPSVNDQLSIATYLNQKFLKAVLIPKTVKDVEVEQTKPGEHMDLIQEADSTLSTSICGSI